MRRLDAVFLDVCGVLYDCGDALAAQWRRLVGEYLVPRLGGSRRHWERANAVALERAMGRYRETPPSRRGHPREYRDREYERWLADMCEVVGLRAPAGASAVALAESCVGYVTPRLQPTLPESAKVTRALAARGYVLHTAGNPWSIEIDGYLRALGVRELFKNLYGPDLVGVWKDGPAFYRAIADHAGVPPERAVVVDDNPQYAAAASAAGMMAFLVSSGVGVGARPRVVRSLAEVLDQLD